MAGNKDMKCDYFSFLIIKTTKEGRATVAASSDSLESIEDNYLYMCKIYAEEIAAGLFRFDIYKA